MDNLLKYKSIANSMLVKHNLTNWKFEVDDVKSRLGQCRYATKTIAISKYIVNELKHEEIIDTIKHEIAHALTKGHGHNKVWKNKCIELGCRPLSKYYHLFSIFKANEEHKFEGCCPHL